MSTPMQSLSLVIPSRLALVDRVCDTMSGFLNRLNFTENVVYAFDLSLREALINAMKHGNHWDETLPVSVVVEVMESDCVIRVRDSGKHSTSIPERSNDLLAPNGRGLLIMRSIMDSVEFNRTHDYFEIAMRKRVDLYNVTRVNREFKTRIPTRTA